MKGIALQILLGDRAKYFGLVAGVAFATLLMAQQVSIFIGLMTRTASAIFDVTEAQVWVMDPRVRYLEEVEPLREVDLFRVRSVKNVEWAVPYIKTLATAKLPDGLTQQVQLVGVDDLSLVGICPTPKVGDRLSIRDPGAALMDLNGYAFTWPNKPVISGRSLEVNDKSLLVTGVCEARPTFLTFPILYTTYETAISVLPPTRNKLSFVLAKPKPGVSAKELATEITNITGLQALTQREFAWRSIKYILERTGIPVNFGITVALGVIIGAAITAQTFFIFVLENLKQFAAMKAIGVTNRQLLGMVMTQAAWVAAIGYSLGIGFTAAFFRFTNDAPALKGFVLHYEVVIGVAFIVALIVACSVVTSLRKVFSLDPAIVFRG
jgi:putative ABC transport system permease protein